VSFDQRARVYPRATSHTRSATNRACALIGERISPIRRSTGPWACKNRQLLRIVHAS
jgi:hypothetical protein